MKKIPLPQSGIFNPRILVAFALCAVGALPPSSARLRAASRWGVLPLLLAALLGTTALALWPVTARAQIVDTTLWVTNGIVNAVVRSENTIYIGGSFSYVGPYTGGGVALDVATGTPTAPFPKVTGTINTVVSDGAGGWYIGGSFTAVGAVARSNIARVLADGSVSAWDPNANSTVSVLVVSGTTVYAGGVFTSIGGQPRNHIAALDASSGVATAWDPNASDSVFALAVDGSTVYAGGVFTIIGGQTRNYIAALDAATGTATAWNPIANSNVYALAVDGSTVYAGGDFTIIGLQPRNHIAALDATTGLTTGLATAWDPNANFPVNALAVSGSTVYAGGQFTSVGGQPRNHIAALDATTGVATAWDPNVLTSDKIKVDPAVNALAVSGSTVYAGGQFTSVGGQTRNHIAALDATTGAATAWDPNASDSVNALAVSGPTVYAGGQFTSVGGQPRNRIAALDATTGVATAWDPNASAAVAGGDIVFALAVSGSTVYAGGFFTSVGGQPRNRIAALDATTGVATEWNPNANNSVRALAVSGSTVYAGGGFTSIGGKTRNRIAALDATTGLATDWNPNVSISGSGVRALAVSGSTVYAGGFFTGVGGQTRNYIAAIDASTGLVTDWNPNATGPVIPFVIALAVNGSTVYAGGGFTGIGGQPRNYLAALDATTGLATDWDPNASTVVNVLAVDGPTVYAGGQFRSVGGQTRNYLAALDASTGLATDWNPNVSHADDSFSSPMVNALALSGSTVYAGGDFTSIGGQPQSNFASISQATSAPVPISAVSRKTHGSAGTFDVDLPFTGNPGIECRSGGANNDYEMIITFASPVTFTSAAMTSGAGTVASTSTDGTQVTVNLTGVTNAQTITLTLSGVSDGTNTGDVGVRMSVLLGDTTADGAVNASDISQTKSQSGQVTTATNFRTDVNVNGVINASDISTVKSRSGTALP